MFIRLPQFVGAFRKSTVVDSATSRFFQKCETLHFFYLPSIGLITIERPFVASILGKLFSCTIPTKLLSNCR